MPRLSAVDLLNLVIDNGSFDSWDTPAVEYVVDEEYASALAAARGKTGLDESVITGLASVRGRKVVILLCEFSFLAGSIGCAAGERLVTAVRRATAERLPLLALPVSGGTRMQEGTVAFLQMVRITAAITAHKAAHLPYIVYLRNPTTGGVFASWGSLGHMTIAEPGALVGFLGPRVYEALFDAQFPAGVQTSENLQAHGLIDAIRPPDQLGEIVDRALRIMTDIPSGAIRSFEAPRWTIEDVPAWTSIVASRRADRPGVRELLSKAAADILPLNGTGQGESDPGLLLALVRFGDMPCVLLGQDRCGQATEASLGPAALREARRGMRLAQDLELPLVTVIDTAGAVLSKEAEEGGLAGEIASCIAAMIDLNTATVSLLLGQGAGGGALALVPADRVLAAQHAWLSPLPPEGASAIVHRDIDHAADMAAKQGVRSLDLLRAGIVDIVIPELPDAADETQHFCDRVGTILHHELAELLAQDSAKRTIAREKRFNRIGSMNGKG
ncbi:carboxyl transferase domain-containing protein [Rhodococcus sp. NPDC060176]|uniref:carboxyl transferase domain-containing protein n=1 Tax=Rhodococcus sp. NPDC060176 TaxID=3347062 RepID=UPI0036632496